MDPELRRFIASLPELNEGETVTIDGADGPAAIVTCVIRRSC